MSIGQISFDYVIEAVGNRTEGALRMMYLVQGLLAPQNDEEYRDFIGSPEHLRRMSHHINALNELRMQRIRSGHPYRMVVIGMGSPVETSILRTSGGGPTITDGPFAETKEVMAGFNLIDFSSRDEAIEFARSEHVPDADYTQVIRGVKRMWWGESIKSAVSANVFLLRVYRPERPDADNGEEKLARHLQRVGAEYAQGRGTIDDNNLAWSIVLLEPFTGTAVQCRNGKTSSVEIPKSSDGCVEAAFVLTACASIAEARTWAERIAAHDGVAVEIRSITRYSWTSLD